MQGRSDASVWLERSEGFVVESAESRVGVVDGVRYDAGSGAADCLIVRHGILGRHRMMISVGDIREILPRQKRIRLQPTWMTIRA